MTVPGAGPLADAASARGIATRRLPLGPPDRRSAAAVRGVAAAPVALHDADAVLLNGLPAQRVVPALALVGAPALLRVNNPLPEPPAAWSRRGFWDRVAAVVADSDHVAAECERAGAPAGRIITAYPAAWAGEEPPGALAAARDREPSGLVGFVGRIEPRKGVAELVAAAGGFLHNRPHARLRIVGEPQSGDPGSYAEIAVEAARTSAAAERIEFVGFDGAAAGAMTELDLLVVPSLEEPFGTVAAEAAAAGTAVVASHVGGLSEVVLDGETGVLVPPGDPARLAEAVGALLDDPDRLRALGRNALEHAQRFSPGAYADTIASVLDRATAPPA